MRVFSRGFNLYNQLNISTNCVSEFSQTWNTEESLEEPLSDLILRHSFSLLLYNKTLKIQSDFAQSKLNLENVIQVAANNEMILILNENRELFKVLISNLNEIKQLPKFTENHDKIKLISCGSKLNVAYTEAGCIYSIPEKLEFGNRDIVDVKTGHEHCVLLDVTGNVYTFGRGSRGQLGHGVLENEQNPRLVEALAGIKITKIAAGGWHTAAVSQDGDLYTWGWNGNGQLGLSISKEDPKHRAVMAAPHVVDIENCSDRLIIDVACGSKHTVLLFESNVMYGCGWNKYKQLKNEEQENVYAFDFLHDFEKERVQRIICGPWNTASLCN